MSREREERGGRGRDEESRSSRGRDEGGRGRGRDEESRGRSSGYRYQSRSADAVKKRGESGGSDFDRFLSDEVKMFKPNDKDNVLRIFPPTWEGAEHFGFDVWVHYDVGPDGQTYLCLNKMKGESCPICDARKRAGDDGDSEYADKLKPNKRVLVYLLDRDNEKEGVQCWSMPWSVDRDICKLMVDKKSGELLPIDHPEEGYDIEFERKGTGTRTQYIGLAIARRASELGAPKLLEWAADHPLPKMLHYYPYDHIAKVFGGSGSKSSKRGDDVDEQDEELRRKEQERSRSRGRDDDEPTYEDVHEMKYEELCALIDSKNLDINPEDSHDDDELADWICEDLRLEKKVARRETSDRGGRSSERDSEVDSRMEKLRRRQAE